MAAFELHEIAKRKDTGRLVRIIEVLPIGVDLFYRAEDCDTGATDLYRGAQLRPTAAVHGYGHGV